MVKKQKECCNGSVVAVKIFSLAGMYILTWGLIGSAAWKNVLGSPIFWGLFLFGLSRCAMSSAHSASMCKA